jgi:hypothetical protein
MSACSPTIIPFAAAKPWQPHGLDRTTGPLMFYASLLFMIFFSLMLHLEIDPDDTGELRWEFARLTAAMYWIFLAAAFRLEESRAGTGEIPQRVLSLADGDHRHLGSPDCGD